MNFGVVDVTGSILRDNVGPKKFAPRSMVMVKRKREYRKVEEGCKADIEA